MQMGQPPAALLKKRGQGPPLLEPEGLPGQLQQPMKRAALRRGMPRCRVPRYPPGRFGQSLPLQGYRPAER